MPTKTAPAPPTVPNLRKQCAPCQHHIPSSFALLFGGGNLDLDQPARVDQPGDLHRRSRRLVGLGGGSENFAIGPHHSGEVHPLAGGATRKTRIITTSPRPRPCSASAVSIFPAPTGSALRYRRSAPPILRAQRVDGVGDGAADIDQPAARRHRHRGRDRRRGGADPLRRFRGQRCGASETASPNATTSFRMRLAPCLARLRA